MSLVARTLDARFLNAVANDASVRPDLGGEGPIDLSAVVADPVNVALRTELGGWVFVRHEPGTYELHTLFMPAGRGRACLAAWREAARYVFAATDAREIVTRVPVCNRGAAWAARHCGFAERFARKAAFRAADGRLHDVSYQALTLDRWAGGDDEALTAGDLFHARIELAKAAARSALPDHPPDEAHDRAAGAASLMIAAGNARKGVWFYNRWAALAGYPPVALLTEHPLAIDVGSGVIVEVREGNMEVIRCP
jgi:hypothetical protein